jgi:hypothetical protein
LVAALTFLAGVRPGSPAFDFFCFGTAVESAAVLARRRRRRKRRNMLQRLGRVPAVDANREGKGARVGGHGELPYIGGRAAD